MLNTPVLSFHSQSLIASFKTTEASEKVTSNGEQPVRGTAVKSELGMACAFTDFSILSIHPDVLSVTNLTI